MINEMRPVRAVPPFARLGVIHVTVPGLIGLPVDVGINGSLRVAGNPVRFGCEPQLGIGSGNDWKFRPVILPSGKRLSAHCCNREVKFWPLLRQQVLPSIDSYLSNSLPSMATCNIAPGLQTGANV